VRREPWPGLRERVLQEAEHRAVPVQHLHGVLGEVAILTLPPTATVPSSGEAAPATSLSRVDLPAPLTPMTHQRSLRRTEKSSPS
jgi:hypothetical protein